ncbi:putative phage abortive infection protein [Metabacillus idriensis]|uniref:putative phage abortive infection protein n=1 Tax=Metabacillus idriensis TaxID=324768 RepID=UPI001748E3F3|nr:putative phage abortive infection protein [Metabacillus idriensis]
MSKFNFDLETLWKCLAFIWILPLSGYLQFGWDFSKLGPYGDFVAGTTVPFLTFISFLGIVITLKMQRDQLELQRIELQNSIKEMRDTRKEFEEQNKTMASQRFENTFFQMVTLHNDIVESLHFGSNDEKRGRNAFPSMYQSLKNNLLNKIRNDQIFRSYDELTQIQTVYETFYNYQEHQLGHYFRNLYRIVKFIDESERITFEDKKTYIGIVKAQLSSNELVFLFYNGLSNNGEKFRPLMIKYNLLDNLNKEKLLSESHYPLFF